MPWISTCSHINCDWFQSYLSLEATVFFTMLPALLGVGTLCHPVACLPLQSQKCDIYCINVSFSREYPGGHWGCVVDEDSHQRPSVICDSLSPQDSPIDATTANNFSVMIYDLYPRYRFLISIIHFWLLLVGTFMWHHLSDANNKAELDMILWLKCRYEKENHLIFEMQGSDFTVCRHDDLYDCWTKHW